MTEAEAGASVAQAEPPKNDFTDTQAGEQVKAAIVPPKEEPAPTKTEPAATEEETAADGSEQQGKPKKRPGMHERRALKLQKENEDLKARLAAAPAVQTAPAAQQQAPASDDYPTADKWTGDWDSLHRAQTEWIVKDNLSKQEVSRKQREEAETIAERTKRVSEQLESLSTDDRDLIAELQEYRGPASPHMRDALFESEHAGKLIAHVLDHPEEAAKMAKMSPTQVGRYVGDLEKKVAPATTAKPAAKTSNAPPPIEPVRSSAGVGGEPPDNADFDTWNAWRKAQQRRR